MPNDSPTGSPTVALVDVDWPRPRGVCVAVTTRAGGVSRAPYDALNLALHTGDRPRHVLENRRRVQATAGVAAIQWLRQVHGTGVWYAGAGQPADTAPEADAAWTDAPGIACAILTADCLPVLLCDREARVVAAAHAGWRGLVGGVLSALIRELPPAPERLLAWLGPAISAPNYEVGDDVRASLIAGQGAATAEAVMLPRSNGRWSLDLYRLARRQLAALGVTDVYGGGFCTLAERRFYSYRRDGATGRMAAMIWLR